MGFLIWVALGIVGWMIGSRKGMPVASLLIVLLFGPIGIVVALLSKGNRVPCPSCRELIHADATVCPHCRRPHIPSTARGGIPVVPVSDDEPLLPDNDADRFDMIDRPVGERDGQTLVACHCCGEHFPDRLGKCPSCGNVR